ncbi:MAG: hypothetical protein KIT02_15405 [Devosia sp.]|uniref:hypothetical protein n=1 Tax=Devosia sp. TaxID=1871048 RepID=UPI0024CAB68E|nr:hypothetical protein [Devosia sp.]UYN99285.1 MAG: hypothetical protein KIT02_15405 [Devosia sp.]
MSPKERAVQTAIATIEKAVRKALDAALPQVMADLFDAGGAAYAAALQQAMHSMSTPLHPVLPVSPPETQTPGAPGKDGRAPRGSIRRAVLTVLLPKPDGLTASEVVTQAQEIDPSISAGGIHNELNRQKGMIYINEDGRWRVPPELKLGGDYYDLNELRNPEKDRATEPREL